MDYRTLVKRIEFINSKEILFRTVTTGLFHLNLETRARKKVFNVEPGSPEDVDWALNESKTKFFAQTQGHKIVYISIDEILKKEKKYQTLELPSLMAEGLSYIKNIKKELFIIRAATDIFLIEKTQILNRFENELVKFF